MARTFVHVQTVALLLVVLSCAVEGSRRDPARRRGSSLVAHLQPGGPLSFLATSSVKNHGRDANSAGQQVAGTTELEMAAHNPKVSLATQAAAQVVSDSEHLDSHEHEPQVSSLLETGWHTKADDLSPKGAMDALFHSKDVTGKQGSCIKDQGGVFVGCKHRCWCDLWQQCFPHYVSWEEAGGRKGGKPMSHVDIGVCHASMEFLAIASLMVIFVSLGVVVIARMVLQFVEDKAEKGRQTFRPNHPVVNIDTRTIQQQGGTTY